MQYLFSVCFSSNLCLSLPELIILGFQVSCLFSIYALPRNNTESPAYGAAVNMLGHGLEASVGTQLGGDDRGWRLPSPFRREIYTGS